VKLHLLIRWSKRTACGRLAPVVPASADVVTYRVLATHGRYTTDVVTFLDDDDRCAACSRVVRIARLKRLIAVYAQAEERALRAVWDDTTPDGTGTPPGRWLRLRAKRNSAEQRLTLLVDEGPAR